jgi:hypothetical protein
MRLLYDLINLQIAEAASTTRKPVFEVAEMTTYYLLLIDLRLPEHGNINQYPAYVVSLLSRLCILSGRRIFFNGIGDKLYELTHDNGKFSRLSQRSENAAIVSRMHELMQTYPDLTARKKSSKKITTHLQSSKNELCDYLTKYLRDNAKGKHAVFSVSEYSDSCIHLFIDYSFGKIPIDGDIAWLISLLYNAGYLEDRKVFIGDAKAEISHVKGKFQEIRTFL